MSRILVSLYAYHPFANANTNIMQPLIDRLKTEHDVTVFTRRYRRDTPVEEGIDGVKVIRYKKLNRLYLHILEACDAEKKKRALWKQAVIALIQALDRRLHLIERTDQYQRLKRTIASEGYDLIIATCESYQSMKVVLRLKQNSEGFPKWVSYFMDPHTYYIGNQERMDHLLAHERQVYENSDLVLTTEEIFHENHTNALRDYIAKTRPIPFGNLRQQKDRSKISLSDRINCVYAGSLNDLAVRNPEHFLKMIQKLDGRFSFYLIIKGLSPEMQRLICKYLIGCDNVEIKRDLSLEESFRYIQSADILVNLGNRTLNQTPSKVFDYISSGKPIVNLHSLAEDRAKHHLKNYAYHCNLLEDDSLLDENCAAFTAFCIANYGKRMDAEQILIQYGVHLPEAAAERFAREINGVLS